MSLYILGNAHLHFEPEGDKHFLLLSSVCLINSTLLKTPESNLCINCPCFRTFWHCPGSLLLSTPIIHFYTIALMELPYYSNCLLCHLLHKMLVERKPIDMVTNPTTIPIFALDDTNVTYTHIASLQGEEKRMSGTRSKHVIGIGSRGALGAGASL